MDLSENLFLGWEIHQDELMLWRRSMTEEHLITIDSWEQPQDYECKG